MDSDLLSSHQLRSTQKDRKGSVMDIWITRRVKSIFVHIALGLFFLELAFVLICSWLLHWFFGVGELYPESRDWSVSYDACTAGLTIGGSALLARCHLEKSGLLHPCSL